MDRWVVVVGSALLSFASPGIAQQTAIVEGRVVSIGGPAIRDAVVILEGRLPRRTSGDGVFRFEGVELGEYTLRVEAFGYGTVAHPLVVDDDVSITVELEVAPFELDPLVAEPRRIDLRGRVVDGESGAALRDADVRTNQTHQERTNNGGRFRLEVWETTPLLVQVRAFGYFGVDSVVVPEPDVDVMIKLDVDPFVERLIATEIDRIEDRAGGRLAITMRPIDRDDLLRWDNATLVDVIQREYPTRSRRVRCVIVDERSLTAGMAEGVLLTTLAREVERMEFLFDGAMLRVYTRDFMRTMLGSGIELRRPVYVDWAEPPLCR